MNTEHRHVNNTYRHTQHIDTAHRHLVNKYSHIQHTQEHKYNHSTQIYTEVSDTQFAQIYPQYT